MTPIRRLRALWMRVIGLGHRGQSDARVLEEMRDHLDHLAESYQREGFPAGEARRRAAAAFGGIEPQREAGRDQLAAMTLDRLLADVRVAVRMLVRSPLSTLTIVATLGVCIGVTTAMFSTVYGVLLRGLPFNRPDELVWMSSVRPDRWDAPFTLPEFMDFRERARQSDIAAFGNWSAGWQTPDGVRRLQGMRMSANGFGVLGVGPAAGRLLETADDDPASPHVVVLSHSLWSNSFGGSHAVIGTTLRLNGEPFTVIGVLPKLFPWQLRGVDVVVPLVPNRDPLRYARGSVNFLRLFGRLPSVGQMPDAERELSDITAALKRQFPQEYETKIGVRLTPMREYLVGPYRQQLLVMLGCVVLMLCIGFSNVVNLLSIRATVRQGELAVRRAVGASTGRLASQLLTEGFVLVFAGGMLGLLIAGWCISLTGYAGPLDVLRLDEVRLDTPALIVAIALSTIATVVASLVPLGVALKTRPEAALRGASRTLAQTGGQRRLRAAFMVAQVALALVLTCGTATLVESLRRLSRVDLGYQPDSVFVTRLSLPAQRYRQPSDVARFSKQLHDNLGLLPSVVAAGEISVAPLSGVLRAVNFSVVGVPTTPTRRPLANYRTISSEYFTTVRASMVAGRSFEERDNERAMTVAIVSRALGDRYLPAGAVGHQLLIDDNNVGPRPVTIVGVVDNLRHVTIDGEPTLDIYLPITQVPQDGVALVANSQFWVVRLNGSQNLFESTFRRTVRQIEPDAATSGADTLRSYVDASLAPRRVSAVLLTGFAAVALVLAVMGVYGVVAYGVQLQRHDLAVRLALGASSERVIAFVLRRALVLAGAGVVAGAVGALIGAQALEGLAFGVAPRDPRVLVAAASLLLAAAMVASWIPAWRASRIDPRVTLHAE